MFFFHILYSGRTVLIWELRGLLLMGIVLVCGVIFMAVSVPIIICSFLIQCICAVAFFFGKGVLKSPSPLKMIDTSPPKLVNIIPSLALTHKAAIWIQAIGIHLLEPSLHVVVGVAAPIPQFFALLNSLGAFTACCQPRSLYPMQTLHGLYLMEDQPMQLFASSAY